MLYAPGKFAWRPGSSPPLAAYFGLGLGGFLNSRDCTLLDSAVNFDPLSLPGAFASACVLLLPAAIPAFGEPFPKSRLLPSALESLAQRWGNIWRVLG